MNDDKAAACFSGGILERGIISSMSAWGFSLLSYKEWAGKMRRPLRSVVRGVPFTTIYGTPGRTEFGLVLDSPEVYARVECKWQNTSGSVDEKFPYLAETFAAVDDPAVILVYGGDWFEKSPRGTAAIAWMRARLSLLEQSGAKQIARVMTLAEFMSWSQTRFSRGRV